MVGAAYVKYSPPVTPLVACSSAPTDGSDYSPDKILAHELEGKEVNNSHLK